MTNPDTHKETPESQVEELRDLDPAANDSDAVRGGRKGILTGDGGRTGIVSGDGG